MSDGLFLFILSVFALFWGYMSYRNLWRGQFRRRGAYGWHRRKTNPVEWAFYTSTNMGAFLLFVGLIIWLLAGKPHL